MKKKHLLCATDEDKGWGERISPVLLCDTFPSAYLSSSLYPSSKGDGGGDGARQIQVILFLCVFLTITSSPQPRHENVKLKIDESWRSLRAANLKKKSCCRTSALSRPPSLSLSLSLSLTHTHTHTHTQRKIRWMDVSNECDDNGDAWQTANGLISSHKMWAYVCPKKPSHYVSTAWCANGSILNKTCVHHWQHFRIEVVTTSWVAGLAQHTPVY